MCVLPPKRFNHRMRIALITEVFLPAVDGVVTRLRHTLEELRKAGDEVLVIAPAGGPPDYAGAKVVSMPGLRMPLYPDGVGYPEKRISLPRGELGGALREFRPEVIHAVNPVLLAAGAVYQAKRQGVPLVASYHAHLPSYARYYGLGFLEPAGWVYIRTLHNRAEVNLCTSRATLANLEQRGIRRLALWPYGVEHDRFRPLPDDRNWRSRLSGGHPDRLILLYVGRLAREKDVGRLLPAVQNVDGVALAIVGDGPERAELERHFEHTPTAFLGLLTGDDLARAYAAADVFVFPSGTETLGIAMLEARSAGLPVLSADSTTAREMLRDGIDGLLFDPGDGGSLASAVKLLAEDPHLRASMGRQGRQAVQDASWAEATDVLREHYRRACGAGELRDPRRRAHSAGRHGHG
jgi:glycosyltransferase involved in cell wall biosynthesis